MEEVQKNIHDENETKPRFKGEREFLMHLVTLYFVAIVCCPICGLVIYRISGAAGQVSPAEFLFSHLFALSFVLGFISGLGNIKSKSRAAIFVCIVPIVILGYVFFTFPTSILEDHLSAFARHYFVNGFLIPEFQSNRDLFQTMMTNSDARRGVDQLWVTAPVYSGVAYSVAAYISLRGFPEKWFGVMGKF
jgi:hypothetical protein